VKVQKTTDPFVEAALDEKTVKTLPCAIVSSDALDYMSNLHRDAVDGLFNGHYILKNPVRRVSYHPKQACHRFLNLCCYVEVHGWAGGTRELFDTLISELEAHLSRDGEEIFVTYPFEYKELGKTLEADWSCALGQAFLLGACVKLYRTTSDAKFLDYARRTYASLRRIRSFEGQQEPWVTYIDDEGFLWFEEYPSDTDPQTRILNGHIYAIMGLYTYYLLEPSADVRNLMQTGLATVQRYFNDFRRPGRVNRYSLLPESGQDYMPSRSVLQQKWLFDVTGNQVFNRQYKTFKSDMGWSLERPGEETYNEP